MIPSTEHLNVYRELADRYEQLGQASMRDRFLLLAADAALQASLPDEAERLRQRLLRQSRHHMLRPYHSFAEAMTAVDVQTYLHDLRVNYPLDLALQLLHSLQEEPTPSTSKTPLPSPREGQSWRSAAIPPTAPVIDPFAASSRLPEPTWEAATPYRVHEEEPRNVPADLVDSHPPAAKALARLAPRDPQADTAPPYRPTIPLPVAREFPPLPSAVSPPNPEISESIPSTWTSALLVTLVLAFAVALISYTLARPFLPREWLP